MIKNSRLAISMDRCIRILVITFALLCIPLIAMQLTSQVAWKTGDFLVAAILLVGFGYLYELLVKNISGKKYQLLMMVGLLTLFLLVWSILAVDLI